ncbi:MAG: hypothetical protein NZ553_13525 [Caldilinea sp.]|nr:hypothetical protein [Caldilinea sp.]MDW8441492.1 hypothetical protein [Caldilineaceae bacterium]
MSVRMTPQPQAQPVEQLLKSPRLPTVVRTLDALRVEQVQR